jgi:hypothetical protein
MPSAVTTSKLSVLELVYPPMSNQEAVWLQSDPEVRAEVQHSDFYMIAARQEVKFSPVTLDQETGRLTFTLSFGGATIDSVHIQPRVLASLADHELSGVCMEGGDKMLRFWLGEPGAPSSELLDWFTTERLLWERSRDRPGIEGLTSFRKLLTYDLLYVGIAKKGDSFTRLLARGHKARMDILANEPQRLPGSRVTDEIYLFLFRINPLVIRTFHSDHDFANGDFSADIDCKRIVVDAEKAFVSLLKPDYNVVRFSTYPKGTDGLYGSDYTRYVYAIAENIELRTLHGLFRGGWDSRKQMVSNEADGIFVEKDIVKLVAGDRC